MFWGVSIVSTFIGDGPIKLAHRKKKRKEVGIVRHPQLKRISTREISIIKHLKRCMSFLST
jgi:hypothetical protein